MSKKVNKNRIILYIYGFIIVALLLIITFGTNGFVKYMSLKGEINDLRNELERTHKELANLDAEIDSLKTSRDTIEKMAREKFRMKRPEEEAVKIEEK